jgi:hypothetical protein
MPSGIAQHPALGLVLWTWGLLVLAAKPVGGSNQGKLVRFEQSFSAGVPASTSVCNDWGKYIREELDTETE